MICAIVLAAGESRRMGTQKLILPFGGKTVIEHVVEQITRGAVDKVFVVVGHECERIAAALSGGPVSVVTNAGYKDGMLSSVRCGLRALPKRCKAILVALGDQPGVTSELIDAMIRFFADCGKGILVPAHGGKRGHPLLFSSVYREEILAQFDNEGLRGLLRAHPEDVAELAAPHAAVLSDMDYPEDYRRELGAIETAVARASSRRLAALGRTEKQLRPIRRRRF